jgi:hypothetical protein
MHFLVFFLNLPLNGYKIALLFEKNSWITPVFLFDLTQICISKKFDKEIALKSSVLARIRSRFELTCWIRIHIESIRIHNPSLSYSTF